MSPDPLYDLDHFFFLYKHPHVPVNILCILYKETPAASICVKDFWWVRHSSSYTLASINNTAALLHWMPGSQCMLTLLAKEERRPRRVALTDLETVECLRACTLENISFWFRLFYIFKAECSLGLNWTISSSSNTTLALSPWDIEYNKRIFHTKENQNGTGPSLIDLMDLKGMASSTNMIIMILNEPFLNFNALCCLEINCNCNKTHCMLSSLCFSPSYSAFLVTVITWHHFAQI